MTSAMTLPPITEAPWPVAPPPSFTAWTPRPSAAAQGPSSGDGAYVEAPSLSAEVNRDPSRETR